MVNVLIFSPTGNSRQVALKLASAFDQNPNVIDLCDANLEVNKLNTELPVIVAGPVFGGRIPALMAQRLKLFCFQETKVVTLVTYGNRAYEDALIELNDLVRDSGGLPIASAAIVSKHSMVSDVALDRPNELDFYNIERFAEAIKTKLKDSSRAQEVCVPGCRPYRQWQRAPLTPIINGHCIHCGLCSRICPSLAIDPKDPSRIDAQKCILCMRCISSCVTKARGLPMEVQKMISEKLEPVKKVHRNSEFFI